MTLTFAGFHNVNAFTGAADQDRHELQWQYPIASGAGGKEKGGGVGEGGGGWKALSLMHAKPAYDWTLDELAKQAGLSRSVLAERIMQFVGIPPMQYLAKWRMQIAAELLTGSNVNVGTIAAQIGYESEAAFSRAFKKMIGVPPSAWRRTILEDRAAGPG